MNIDSSTIISFPGGNTSELTDIIFHMKMPTQPNKLLILTRSTPFHPLDYHWPDQPSDKGSINMDNKIISVEECLIGAIHKITNEFLLDQEIKNAKIRRDDSNWHFVVVHIVDSGVLNDDPLDLTNKKVYLEVDTKYRLALSKSHTACHLAALALNQVTAKFWKKPAEYYDSLGNPDFDREAIALSKINEEESIDHYRCGKSLRKKGFDCQLALTENVFKEIEAAVNSQLLDWCSNEKGLKISVSPAQTYLNEGREWHCHFSDEKKGIIPCGGTHINTIAKNEKIIVTLEKENEQEFKMVSKMITLS